MAAAAKAVTASAAGTMGGIASAAATAITFRFALERKRSCKQHRCDEPTEYPTWMLHYLTMQIMPPVRKKPITFSAGIYSEAQGKDAFHRVPNFCSWARMREAAKSLKKSGAPGRT